MAGERRVRGRRPAADPEGLGELDADAVERSASSRRARPIPGDAPSRASGRRRARGPTPRRSRPRRRPGGPRRRPRVPRGAPSTTAAAPRRFRSRATKKPAVSRSWGQTRSAAGSGDTSRRGRRGRGPRGRSRRRGDGPRPPRASGARRVDEDAAGLQRGGGGRTILFCVATSASTSAGCWRRWLSSRTPSLRACVSPGRARRRGPRAGSRQRPGVAASACVNATESRNPQRRTLATSAPRQLSSPRWRSGRSRRRRRPQRRRELHRLPPGGRARVDDHEPLGRLRAEPVDEAAAGTIDAGSLM